MSPAPATPTRAAQNGQQQQQIYLQFLLIWRKRSGAAGEVRECGGGHNNIRAFCLSHFVPGHALARPQSRPLSCLPLLVSLLTFGSVSFLSSFYLPPPLTLPRPACCLLLSPTLAASVGGGLCGARGVGGMERSRRVCGLWR